jgi:glycosyltransferase involved in cell wall biosynthesis
MRFFEPLMRTVIRRSDAVTAISTHTASEVHRLVPEARVHLIPFGAAIAPGDTPPVRRAVSRPFRLLFTGRLVARKGVDVLLRALALLEGRDVRLAVVGDGPLRARWTEQAAALGLGDRVEFAGFVAAGELTRRFDECDAFVLPAVEDAKGDVEGLGVVLIEALLHARPVIASASGGIPDIVLDGRTGLLVPPGDAPALAGAIARLMDDPALGARLTEAGRAHVEERFSWDAIVARLAGIYETVAGGRERAVVRGRA